MSGLALVMTVGRSTPSSSSAPPVSTLAPAASASATHDTTRSRLVPGDERRHVGGLVERVADDQGVDVIDQRRGEVVGDRAVDVDALRRDAALAGVAEAGHLDLGGGRLPVAVGLDDDRSVVAELEADALARERADAPTDIGRAGERDQGDVGMIDDRVADRAAAAGDDVEVLGGQAALVDQHLGQFDRAERCLAGRLEHDGTTGGDRRSELVGDEVEREVERGDRADDADRHAEGEAQLAFAGGDRVERDHLPRQLARLGGGELERADGALGLGARS